MKNNAQVGTTLPIVVDVGFVKEGLQHTAGEELSSNVAKFSELVNELANGNAVGRDEFRTVFEKLRTSYDRLLPVLEYAEAFTDD